VNSQSLDRRQFLAALAAGAAAGVLPACSTAPRGPGASAHKDRWTMKLSTSSVHFRSLPVEQACERISALGFEAVDFWPAKFGCPHLDEIQNRLGPSGLKDLLARTNLKLGAFTVYHVGYAQYAEVLGQAGGGLVVRESKYGPLTKPLRDEMKDFLERLTPEIELAEKYNSYLAIENHGNSLLGSLDSFKAFVDLNRHPRVGIALAPYHLQKQGLSVEEAIAVAGPQLVFFYAWQFAEGLNQLPGIGPTDFASWLRGLARANYRGYVNAFTHYDVPPDMMAEALGKSRNYLNTAAKTI